MPDAKRAISPQVFLLEALIRGEDVLELARKHVGWSITQVLDWFNQPWVQMHVQGARELEDVRFDFVLARVRGPMTQRLAELALTDGVALETQRKAAEEVARTQRARDRRTQTTAAAAATPTINKTHPPPPPPEVVTPEVMTPQAVTPEVVTPEVGAPEVVATEVAAPEAVTPEVVAPQVAIPRAAAPEVVTPEVVPARDSAGAQRGRHRQIANRKQSRARRLLSPTGAKRSASRGRRWAAGRPDPAQSSTTNARPPPDAPR